MANDKLAKRRSDQPEDLLDAPPPHGVQPFIGDRGALGIRKYTVEDLVKSAQVARMEPKILSLKEEGEGVKGIYLGPGAGVEVEDVSTGEMRPVLTWLFEVAPGVTIALMGNYQINRTMEKAELGTVIQIVRGATERTRKGTQVTPVHVFHFGKPASRDGKAVMA